MLPLPALRKIWLLSIVTRRQKILLLIQMIQRSSSSTNRADFRYEQESVSPEPRVPRTPCVGPLNMCSFL